MPQNVKLFPIDSQEGNLQVSNIPSYKGSVADQMSGSAGGDDANAVAMLDELRAQYEQLRSDVATAVAHRAEQASQLAAQGADGLRTQIRSAPVVSLAVAAVAGGLLAVLLTQRRRDRSWLEKAESYGSSLRDYGSSLRDVDVNNLASRLRRSADATYESAREQASGIMPSIERLAQSLSTMDTSTFTPAIEKGTSLFKSMWNSVVPGAKQ